MPTTSRARSWFATNRDLHSLLGMFHHFEATENQDRIYALLGICAEPADGKKVISIDYDKSESEVVRDTVACISGCRVQSLWDGPWASIEGFLARLELIYGQALSTLVRNSEVVCVASMLQKCPGRVQITPAVVALAARDREHGVELVELLLAASASLRITDQVVTEATKNPTQAAGIRG
ncbi:hypothetical protein MN608_10080 [Microdochium nivale]|nr:hypothetical protein MN608_10080 [Microdochium nivale]